MKEQKNSKNQFIRMIYDSFNSDSTNVGTLGEFFLHQAEQLSIEEKTTSSEEAELVRKIKIYKEAEDNKDLVWFDYSSWKYLPEAFRLKLKELADPLYWTGVFFKYSIFIQYEEELMKLLDNTGYLYLLTEHKDNYFMVWVTGDSHHYDWANNTKINDIIKNFDKRLIRSYGKNSENKIVVKNIVRGMN